MPNLRTLRGLALIGGAFLSVHALCADAGAPRTFIASYGDDSTV